MSALDLTPLAKQLRDRYPVGTRVWLSDGRSGVVTTPARDVWQQFGIEGDFIYLGVEVCVQPDGLSYDVWYGCHQVRMEGDV